MDITAPPQSVSTVNREMDASLELELTFQSHLSVLSSGSHVSFIKKQLKVPEAELTSIHTLSNAKTEERDTQKAWKDSGQLQRPRSELLWY